MNQQQYISKLEQTLDQLSTEKWDLEEKLSLCYNERMSSVQIRRLQEELDAEKDLSQSLKSQVDSFRQERVNQDHLAKKVVELHQQNKELENFKLLKEENNKGIKQFVSEINTLKEQLSTQSLSISNLYLRINTLKEALSFISALDWYNNLGNKSSEIAKQTLALDNSFTLPQTDPA